MIPKKIHIIHIPYKNKFGCNEIHEIWKDCYKIWKESHNNYEIILYDNNDIYNIIERHFPEDINTIKQIKIGAILADIFRYLILYLEGGFYVDADCEPLKNMDKLFVDTHYCGNENNIFFIYPESIPLITKEWDFYKNPCNNCKYIETLKNGVMKYECMGHKITNNTNIILCNEYFEEPEVYNNKINNTRITQWCMIAKPKQEIFLKCYKKTIKNVKLKYSKIKKINDKEEFIKEVFQLTGPIHFTRMINTILPNNEICILPNYFFCSGSGGMVPITKNSFVSHKFCGTWLNKHFSKNQKNRPTMCFATMCKNEEHCILETIESCYKYCDYWVVCDTGSTDRTCELVVNFFKEKGIPGELHKDEWVGFGHNKTLMFERCYKKTDYIIHPDADDLLIGDFSFTNEDAGKLAYSIKIKRGGSQYTSLAVWNNNYHWKICGNAHTIARCLDNDGLECGDLTNRDFYLLSRDTGSRSNDPDKYYKDALVLQKQFIDTSLFDEDGLNSRSVFYTAQSFYDSGKMEDSMKWYMIYTKLKDTWNEEIFESYMRISDCMKVLNYEEKFIVGYLNKAIDLFRDRAEPFYKLGEYYYDNKRYDIAYLNFKICQHKRFENISHKYALFLNPYVYGNHVNKILLKCCLKLDKKKECEELL